MLQPSVHACTTGDATVIYLEVPVPVSTSRPGVSTRSKRSPLPAATTNFKSSYNELSEIKFCIDMHEIAIATDNLPLRPPNMTNVDYDTLQINRLEEVVNDYLKTPDEHEDARFGQRRNLRLYRTNDECSWGMTEGCGVCGWKASVQLERRRDFLEQAFKRQNNIPSDRWDDINRLTKTEWQDISSNVQCSTAFTNLVRQRLQNAVIDDSVKGTLITEFNAIFRLGGNGSNPFYHDRNGWFTDGLFTVWFRDNQDSNPNPVRAALVKYDFTVADDFKQASDTRYGYLAHDSMSQHDDPFAYTELQNIVNNGHYVNLSKARAHFGIEPLTDTVSELLMLQESYINLCYNIAVILLRYRKYFNTPNEIQP